MNSEPNNINQNYNDVNNFNTINNNIPNTSIFNQQAPQNFNNFEVAPKKSNKKIILLILALVIIILGLVAFFYFKSKDVLVEGVNLSYVFDPEKPIIIKNNDKYGYISSKGKTLIEPIYISASDFYGDYAIVSVSDSTELYFDRKYQVIDKKGNVKIETYSIPEFYEEENIWIIESTLYDKNFNRITNENVSVSYIKNGYLAWDNYLARAGGIMTSDGKVTYTYHYLEDESYINIEVSDAEEVFKNNYCRINVENEKYAIVNCKTGKVVYDFTTKYISGYSDNIYKISNHDTYDLLYYIYIQDDSIVYKSNGSSAYLYYSTYGGYVSIYDLFNDNYEYRYLDINTKELLTDSYNVTKIEELSEYDLIEQTYGYRPFESGNKYGLLSKDKIVLPSQYDGVGFVNKLLFKYVKSKNNKEIGYVTLDDNVSIMNFKNKKALATFKNAEVLDHNNSTFIKITLEDDNGYTKGYVVYNVLTNKTMNFSKDDKFSIYSNYITLEKNNNKIYYNTDLKQIYVEDI